MITNFFALGNSPIKVQPNSLRIHLAKFDKLTSTHVVQLNVTIGIIQSTLW